MGKVRPTGAWGHLGVRESGDGVRETGGPWCCFPTTPGYTGPLGLLSVMECASWHATTARSGVPAPRCVGFTSAVKSLHLPSVSMFSTNHHRRIAQPVSGPVVVLPAAPGDDAQGGATINTITG